MKENMCINAAVNIMITTAFQTCVPETRRIAQKDATNACRPG